MKILLCDDQAVIRDGLEMLLNLEKDFQVVGVAQDGAEAVELAAQKQPDLILMDLKMPIMNGLEFLREMRRNPERLLTPVLVLSAMDLTPEETSNLPPNVKGVLAKGNILKDQLLEQIRCIINRQPPTLLPKSTPSGNSMPKKKDQSPEVPRGLPQPGGRCILVAEDNPDNLFLITEILKSSEYEMIKASNGQEAIEIASRRHPDLILMDIQMPDMGGIEAIAAIRTHSGLQHIPIVAITAKAMKGDRETILATGCDDYIAKPVEPAILLTVLKKWLGKGEFND